MSASISTLAQTPQAQAQAPIDETKLVTLPGTVHPLAQAQFDRGAVRDSFAAERMLLILQRPADREAALQKFLREVHVPGSPSYHHWVTPDEFGARFGAAAADVATAVAWLQSHGFNVPRVTGSRSFIEFSGTAAQVREALHTEIHQYVKDGEAHYSIASDVQIPEALAPLIRGFAPLNNFELTSYVHEVGSATYSRSTHQATPLFTTSLGLQPFYALAPEDFATQYNLGPLYAAGTDGSGQTIGIIGQTNIDLGLVDAHRTLFGLPASNVHVVIDGQDPVPGLLPNVEGFLDVEVSGSVAPKAVVNFYIGGGSHFQSGLVLAALRAVEDNQASVLSASFGECEALLGASGNKFWSGLWEEAAAQGQTVLVSSGDTGPATCPVLGTVVNGQITLTSFGLSVNGLSSTPWNVSVGGTDFFYPGFASGPSTVGPFWNTNNDPNLGSLKASLQEQVWDNVFGSNVIPFVSTAFSIPSVAGGGGPSNCAQSTGTPPSVVCVAGYAKPSWQNAPGVPADGVRDQPDVSLFAASGKNLSAYPICAEPGDCAPVTTGEPHVLLVGGTSASAPAMAGIMAMVNQKFGRQGQANFTLYALARQQPSVFHDITVGTNDVLCLPGLLDCNKAVPGVNPALAESYGVYPAGSGYDLATGLGSFDGNGLVTNWNKITFLPTSTTLQLSPSTVVHGSPVSVSATVTSSSAMSPAPSGDVDIATTAPFPLPQSGALPLTSGSANSSISFFPGGTYQVTAQYAGDGVFGSSTSAPVNLTVTPEPSTTSLDLRFFYTDFSVTPAVGHSGTVPNNGQVPFSSLFTFEAQPSGQNSQSTGQATGTATFTDGPTSVQAPLNSSGMATWSPQNLSVGQHSVTVSYSGDASYNASSSTPLTFTVTKGIPRLILTSASPFAVGPMSSLPAGSDFDVIVELGATNSTIPPTGTVTVNLGPTLTQTAMLNSAGRAFGNSTASVLVKFAAVPAGTYTLSATYGGDTNWNSATFTDPATITFATATVTSTTTTLTASSTSVATNSSVNLTVTVQPMSASTGAQGEVEILANSLPVILVLLPPPGPGVTAGTLTFRVPGSILPIGSVQLLAIFRGTPGFTSSTSAPVSLTVTPVDFTMSIGASRMIVKSGQSGTVPLLLGGPSGGSVSLSLTCAPSSSKIGCAVNPSSASVNGSMSATLTINAFVPGTTTTASLQHSNHVRAGFFLASACFACAFGVVFVFPGRRRKKHLLVGFAFLALVTVVAGCGGGSMQPPPPPPPPPANAPAGAYTVLVTGTSSGVIHNTQLTVIVQ